MKIVSIEKELHDNYLDIIDTLSDITDADDFVNTFKNKIKDDFKGEPDIGITDVENIIEHINHLTREEQIPTVYYIFYNQ